MKRTTLLALMVPAFAAVLALFPYSKKQTPFHSDAELAYFRQALHTETGLHDPENLLPIDSNILFPIARTCGGCHGFDSTGFALHNNSGVDVNIYDDWRATMMANAARDPFWRAKVTHEILINPEHSDALQDKCTSCHAPAGHYQAKLKRHQTYYSFYEMMGDSLGLDGVTCQICHAQPPDMLGQLNSGQLYFDTNNIRVANGPYEFIFAPPMHNFVGITPKFGPHMEDAGLCAGCHTLITHTADLQGQLTGGTYVEQATYHEWLNSRYDEAHDNKSCQSCHMPRINDEVIISTNYLNLTPKYPFALHELAGANVTMLKLLQGNLNALEIDAEPAHFDSTIAATLRMLQQKTLESSMEAGITNGDTAYFTLHLTNLAGHKFPSGYPSRRAWVEFEVFDDNGGSVFHSGAMNADYTLSGENANFEPHYDVINQPDQVQIYEHVPADVNGNFTNVLERAAYALKDNRLTPKGFSTSDAVYDTTLIVGAALSDPDFNHNDAGVEGSGTDALHFHVPINGYTGTYSVRARIWYQTLPPKWMDPLFAYSSPEIDAFKTMYDAADKSPVLVAEVSLNDVHVTPVGAFEPLLAEITLWPTFSTDGKIQISRPSGTQIKRVQVWNAQGQLVWDKAEDVIWLPAQKGVYMVLVETRRGGRKSAKVVRG